MTISLPRLPFNELLLSVTYIPLFPRTWVYDASVSEHDRITSEQYLAQNAAEESLATCLSCFG